MVIPQFPTFTHLTLKHKPLFDTLLRDVGPSGDYKFPSLWSYNTKEDTEISLYKDNLIVLFRDYITNERFYTCNGTDESTFEELITVALESTKKRNISQSIQLIPEHIASFLLSREVDFSITEDRDSFDYILSLEEVSKLKGGKYHTQKNHLNRFNNLYPDAVVTEINISDPAVQKQLFDLFDRWERGKKKTTDETALEKKALSRMVHDASFFKLFSIGLYHNEQLIGFSINDLEQEETAQNHFAKSDPSYKEVFFKLMNEGAKRLLEKGYLYINIENDMGLPGLRYAKEQWNPVRYIKKYTIVQKV